MRTRPAQPAKKDSRRSPKSRSARAERPRSKLLSDGRQSRAGTDASELRQEHRDKDVEICARLSASGLFRPHIPVRLRHTKRAGVSDRAIPSNVKGTHHQCDRLMARVETAFYGNLKQFALAIAIGFSGRVRRGGMLTLLLESESVSTRPRQPRQRPSCQGRPGMMRTVWWQICGIAMMTTLTTTWHQRNTTQPSLRLPRQPARQRAWTC